MRTKYTQDEIAAWLAEQAETHYEDCLKKGIVLTREQAHIGFLMRAVASVLIGLGVGFDDEAAGAIERLARKEAADDGI